MSPGAPSRIPASTRRWLEASPRDRPVAILLRHAAREELPPDRVGFDVPITPAGARLARELGALMGERLRSLHSSPLPRCIRTAESLAAGAGLERPVAPDRLLGDPGVYVLDGGRAWANWQELGHEGVMAHLAGGEGALPGMADPGPAAQRLLRHMLAAMGEEPGFHVFVTHDALVLPTAARLIAPEAGAGDGPAYLEGAFFWEEGEVVCAAYRGLHRRTASPGRPA